MLFVLVNSCQMTQRNILNARSYRTVTDFSTRFCSVKGAAMCFFDIILSRERLILDAFIDIHTSFPTFRLWRNP